MPVYTKQVHKTHGRQKHSPWEVVVKANKVILYTGGIYDKDKIDSRTKSVGQKSPVKVFSNISGTQLSSYGENSERVMKNLIGNTAPVYWKQGFGYADQNDDSTTSEIKYNRSLFNNGCYIVLSNKTNPDTEENYWSLGVIKKENEDTITNSDITIAYVSQKKVIPIWTSDIYYSKPAVDTNTFPFKITAYSEIDIDYFDVSPGTINNLIPCVNGEFGNDYLITKTNSGNLNFNENNISYIYLVSGIGGENQWPETDVNESNYPNVMSFNETKTDDDDFGYLLLAQVTKDEDGNFKVNQFVRTSIWSQRNKYTEPNSAFYFYWRI